MFRRMKRVTLIAFAVLLATGCGAQRPAKWSAESAAMVVYAKAIPLYPGATARDAMGSDSYGDDEGSHSEGMTIWFEVEGFDKAKVLAWYEKQLPGARTEVGEDAMVTLTVPAPNGEPGEEMGVTVDSDGFRVFEHTRPGKHKDS